MDTQQDQTAAASTSDSDRAVTRTVVEFSPCDADDIRLMAGDIQRRISRAYADELRAKAELAGLQEQLRVLSTGIDAVAVRPSASAPLTARVAAVVLSENRLIESDEVLAALCAESPSLTGGQVREALNRASKSQRPAVVRVGVGLFHPAPTGAPRSDQPSA